MSPVIPNLPTDNLYKTYHSRRQISFDDWMYENEMARIRKAKANANGTYVEPRFCDCPETMVNGERVPCPPQLPVCAIPE
jgi:hypothetical protein